MAEAARRHRSLRRRSAATDRSWRACAGRRIAALPRDHPDANVSPAVLQAPYRKREDLEHHLTLLRRAGLPDCSVVSFGYTIESAAGDGN